MKHKHHAYLLVQSEQLQAGQQHSAAQHSLSLAEQQTLVCYSPLHLSCKPRSMCKQCFVGYSAACWTLLRAAWLPLDVQTSCHLVCTARSFSCSARASWTCPPYTWGLRCTRREMPRADRESRGPGRGLQEGHDTGCRMNDQGCCFVMQ